MMPVLRAILDDLRRDRREVVLATLGVAAGVAALTFFLSLGRGVERAVLDDLLVRLPVNVVKVEPRAGVALGPLRLGAGSLLAPALDEPAVQALRRIEGVQAVYPLTPAQFPMRAQGGQNFLGRTVYMDMFAVGVDPAFVADEVPKDRFADRGPPAEGAVETVPVLASTQLLQIYNRTVAPAIGAPRLTAEVAQGFEFELFLGESYASGRRGTRHRVIARVAGLSGKVPLAGITLPLAVVERWNQRFASGTAVHYSAAYVVARSAREVDAVVRQADALGLSVDDSARVAGALIRGVTALLSLIAALILVVAALHTAQTFEARARIRRREIALLRALGATRRQIRWLLAGEALIVGVLGGLLGEAAGLGGALAASNMLRAQLAGSPFELTRLVAWDPWVVALPLGAALLAAWLGGLGPARRAAQQDPAAVLSGGRS
ncbi:MAG: ABC transporter permease [Pseudomonadota bacterium]